jgi:uncharacterized Zn-finger protein
MTEKKIETITVTQEDLPLSCPMPNAPLWCEHPRVFLPVDREEEVACPYCSTRYKLSK